MISREDILNYFQKNKNKLLDDFELTKIGIFGSFAKNQYSENSDIDIIIEFKQGTEDIYNKKRHLKELIEREFQKEVDICREKYLKPYYKSHILNSSIYV